VGGIVLAAGEGSRFGGAVKQLAELDGRPLLQHVLEVAGDRLDPLVLILGAHADEILRRVPLGPAQPVICEAWRDGQSASLQAAVRALGDVDAAVVLLGDQPFVTREAIEAVLAASPGPARATYGGTPGHPVLLSRDELDRVPELTGDEGARSLLAGARAVECGGLCDPRDVDTPEQLEALR
jgi:CTP:molybdopterin cytidylyltransferase MocA